MRSFETYINEGGQFGHLNNIWEVGNLTLERLVKIIDDSVNLNFGFADLKLDSVALSFTVRADGKVVASRNKGQSKNFGASGLDINSMAEKYKGHALEFAYTWALRNLQDAINHLTDKQKKKIFNDGRNWMAVEVLGWGASNIIDYGGVKELTLLGTVEHDAEGNKVGHVNKENAVILDGMLRQRSAEQQSKFVIKKVPRAVFKEIQAADGLKKELVARLRKLMGRAKTIDDYKRDKLQIILSKKTKDARLIQLLSSRWIDQTKNPSLSEIVRRWPEDKLWIQKYDSDSGILLKNIMLPMEKIFLKLGAEVVSALNVFKSADPEATAAKLRNDLTRAVNTIQASGEEKLVKKLAMELKRLEAAGGVGAIAPEEGITFFLDHGKDRTLVKLTGTFAPVNQIIGLLYNIVER